MSQLALFGGPPVASRPVRKPWPVFDEAEEALLLRAFRSGKWCRLAHDENPQESLVTQFEDAFARYVGAKFAIAVTNGTQALECALKAAGVRPGDEVIVPALTFVATATAVVLVGATPVIVDVDPETYNMDPEAFRQAITRRTKAVIPVHNGGYPCDMDRIGEIAREHGLFVVEDCAHAHGSEGNGRRTGSLGHFGCFSFQQGKTMTAGEGGIVLSSDETLAAAAYSTHNIGRIAGRPAADTTFQIVASNLRMTEFQGAILLGQLSRLDAQIATREANIAYLAREMAAIPGIRPLARDPRVTRWSFYYWNFKYVQEEFEGVPRSLFIRAMNAEGIPVNRGAHGVPIYRHQALQHAGIARVAPCPQADRVADTEALSLPHACFLGGREEMDLILEAMRKVRRNAGELARRAG